MSDAQLGQLGSQLALFGPAIAAALLAGLVVPLVGGFLYVRRTSFHGIVLPQLAAAGIACGFALRPYWTRLSGMPDPDIAPTMEGALGYHLTWACLFTFGGLALLGLLNRRGASETGLLAAAFAVATAATILFAHASPPGETFIHGLIRGEILFVGGRQLGVLGAGLGLVFVTVIRFHRDFTLASYDRDAARVLGRPVPALEALLYAVTGLTVAVGVLTVGPVVLFGLLVLPPIAARPWARSMGGLLALASAIGLVSSAAGVWASFYFDAPVGPSIGLAAAVPLLPGALRRTTAGSSA